VVVPEKLQSSLKAAMEAAGIPVPSADRWEDALNALRVRFLLRACVAACVLACVHAGV
jgi:hypothetical protein